MFSNAVEASSYDLGLQWEKHIFQKYKEKNMGFHKKREQSGLWEAVAQ